MAKIEWRDTQQLHITGAVNFENAAALYAAGKVALQGKKQFPIHVNLSEIEQPNTLLLAVLIQWLRACPTFESLKFVAVPDKMRGIICASNLQHLIVD